MPTAAAKRKARSHGRAATPATREVILDTAEQLFARHGVDGIAVRDLAQGMGITASSLYNHFPGKEALYQAVLERGLRPIVDAIAMGWQDGAHADRVHATLADLTAHLARHPNLAPLLQRALLEESAMVQTLITGWAESLYREGIAVVARTAREAGWKAEEIPHLGVALFGMIFSYFINASALERLAGWDGDVLSARSLAVQRRFLEKAILRMLGTKSNGGSDG